jgi:hypothetical protein
MSFRTRLDYLLNTFYRSLIPRSERTTQRLGDAQAALRASSCLTTYLKRRLDALLK